jgi:hypothetical protein
MAVRDSGAFSDVHLLLSTAQLRFVRILHCCVIVVYFLSCSSSLVRSVFV